LLQTRNKPLLLVDVDGVISLCGFSCDSRPAGAWMNVDGILHLISATAGAHLQALAATFDLVWCTGWEDKANEHLVRALALPGPVPVMRLAARPERNAHWKLAAIDGHAGNRPLAWIDDAFNDACHEWAAARAAPTLLVATEGHVGLTEAHARGLERWAAGLGPGGA
jgi:hypothetical protein